MRVKATRTVGLALHPSLEHALIEVDRAWREVLEEDPVVTGLQEEGHSKKSLHYGILGDVRARAGDLRWRGTEEQRLEIDRRLRARLGTAYDIVWESLGKPNVHLHVEYDPD